MGDGQIEQVIPPPAKANFERLTVVTFALADDRDVPELLWNEGLHAIVLVNDES